MNTFRCEAVGQYELPVEIRAGGEIWVTFRNFRAGIAEQVIV